MTTERSGLTALPAWHALTAHFEQVRDLHLRSLFADDPSRGQRLVVIGNETPWFRPAPDLSACPSGTFRLCLSHTPDTLPWARAQDIDLVLAGHVHGGQVRFARDAGVSESTFSRIVRGQARNPRYRDICRINALFEKKLSRKLDPRELYHV